MIEPPKTRQRKVQNTSAMAALLLCAGMFAGPVDAAPAMPDPDDFRAMAHELLSGISSADFADIPAIGGYDRPRIAVLPLAPDGKAVPAPMASEINARLLAELTRQGRRTFRFVARDSLGSVIKEIDTIGELEPGNDRRVADLLRATRVDILIVGKLSTDADRMVLSYRAVSVEDGTLFAATSPRRFGANQPEPVLAREPGPAPRVHYPAGPTLSPPPMPHRARPDIRHVQRHLAALGYDPGPTDGVLRPRTRTALRAFQRDVGLPANGRLTRQVAERLRRTLRRAGFHPSHVHSPERNRLAAEGRLGEVQ